MKQECFQLSEGDYAKAVGQLTLALNGVMECFHMYGLSVYVPGAIQEIVQLAEDFSLRVRGVDKPINLQYIRRSK